MGTKRAVPYTSLVEVWNHLLYAEVAGCLHDVQGALDVGVHVGIGGMVGVGNRDQRCQVQHDINMLRDRFAVMWIAHVAVDHFDLIQTIDILQPAQLLNELYWERAFTR